MIGTVDEIILYFGLAGTAAESITVAGLGVPLTPAAVIGIKPVPFRSQIKQFGAVINVAFGTQTTDAIMKLQKLTAVSNYVTTVDLVVWTVGPTDANLSFPTKDTTLVGAGGPGTAIIGPTLGANRTPATLALLVAGVVLLAPDSKLPTTVLEAGDLLQVNITTAASGGAPAGRIVPYVRLHVTPEQFEKTNVAISGVTAGT